MRKVVIAILVVLVVAVVALALWRPGANRSGAAGEPPDFVRLIGSMIPQKPVLAADVAGQPCWSDTGRLVVGAGQTCVAELPDRANRLGICVEEGAPLAVAVRGRDYPTQRADLGQLSCSDRPEPLDLYDEQSRLSVTCGPSAVCILRLT